MVRKFQKILMPAILTSVVLVTPPVSAHHSTSGYDYTKSVTLTGTVSKFLWTNPHMFIEVMAPKGGKVVLWNIECGTPNINARQGWKATDLKPGDKVTMEIAPMRTGVAGGTLKWVQLADGRKLRGAAADVVAAPGGPR